MFKKRIEDARVWVEELKESLPVIGPGRMEAVSALKAILSELQELEGGASR